MAASASRNTVKRTADKPDTVIWSPDAAPCGVGKMVKRKMLFHPDYVQRKRRDPACFSSVVCRRYFASLARMHTNKAVKTLAAIMNEPHPPYAARVAAAEALLDRGWGKPRQSHEAEITHRYDRNSGADGKCDMGSGGARARAR